MQHLIRLYKFESKMDIHNDDSDLQLVVVIIQVSISITFYGRKLTVNHTRYTIMEKDTSSLVKTPKYFRTMLLGQHLKLYTRHKTLPVIFQFGNSIDMYTNTQGV